jgi:hypothetical protein
MGVREAVESCIPETDGSITRTWTIDGTIDEEQATAMAFTAAPEFYRARIRDPAPSVDIIGRGMWRFTFRYLIPGLDPGGEDEPTGDLPTIGTIDIDSSGSTQHVTQCFIQQAYGATDQNQAIATALVNARVVGFHKDGVHGVDIDVPGTTYTLTRKFLPQAISGAYLYRLSHLRGHINFYPWTLAWGGFGNLVYSINFDICSLKFMGYRASIGRTAQGLGCWDISYILRHEPNVDNLQIVEEGISADHPPIKVPFKAGHHYLWHLYKKREFVGGTIEIPELTFQSRVCPFADFLFVLGF